MNTYARPHPTAVDPRLRASDGDRQHVVDQLQRHTAEGRLTLEEFATRAEAAHRSSTYGELAALTLTCPAPPRRGRPVLTPATATLAVAALILLVLLTVLLVWWLTGGNMMDHMVR